MGMAGRIIVIPGIIPKNFVRMTKPDQLEALLQLLGGLLIFPWIDDPSDADPCDGYGDGNGDGYGDGYGYGDGDGYGDGYGYGDGDGNGNGNGDGNGNGNGLRRMLE